MRGRGQGPAGGAVGEGRQPAWGGWQLLVSLVAITAVSLCV